MARGPDSTSHPPVETDELVRRALDTGSERTRSEAAAALEPQIRNWAGQTVRGARTPLAREFVEEAPAELLRPDRLAKYTPDHRFEPWCRTVLRRLWIDRLRRHRLVPHHQGGAASTAGATEPAADPVEAEQEAAERLAEARETVQSRLLALRQGLDEVAWPPAGRVDHFAVLLLRLRLILTSRVVAAGLSPTDAGCESLETWIGALLPWHVAEKTRRPATGLPTLGAIWPAFAEAAEGAEGPVEAQLLVGAINGHAPERPVSLAQWYQWVKRAREHVREHHPQRYQEVFAVFLEPAAAG